MPITQVQRTYALDVDGRADYTKPHDEEVVSYPGRVLKLGSSYGYDSESYLNASVWDDEEECIKVITYAATYGNQAQKSNFAIVDTPFEIVAKAVAWEYHRLYKAAQEDYIYNLENNIAMAQEASKSTMRKYRKAKIINGRALPKGTIVKIMNIIKPKLDGNRNAPDELRAIVELEDGRQVFVNQSNLELIDQTPEEYLAQLPAFNEQEERNRAFERALVDLAGKNLISYAGRGMSSQREFPQSCIVPEGEITADSVLSILAAAKSALEVEDREVAF